jgi:hypothetical protein
LPKIISGVAHWEAATASGSSINDFERAEQALGQLLGRARDDITARLPVGIAAAIAR